MTRAEQARERLDALVDEAYRDPRKMRDIIRRAFELGSAASLPPSDAVRRLVARLRRKAKVVQEYDGRSAILEIADELEARS